MTSEVLLMNRGAVAMAADSAVTISGGGSQTIYQSVDKVFQLIEGRPIGVMIYNHADIMNVPWETVISLYKARSGKKKFNTVQEYAEDFLNFLESHDDLFPQQNQDFEFFRTVATVFGIIGNEFDRQVAKMREAGATDVDTHLSAIFDYVVDEIRDAYLTYWDDDSPREDLACFPEDMAARIEKRYGKQIGELVGGLLGRLQQDYRDISLNSVTEGKLREIAIMSITKNAFFEGYTGIVFAGFGERDKFPSMVSYLTGGIYGGLLKRTLDSKEQVDDNSGPVIMPFAQDKMFYTFMTGIDRDFQEYLYFETLRLTHHLVNDVVAQIPSLSEGDKQEVLERYGRNNLAAALRAFFDNIHRYQVVVHMAPIFQAVHMLPRAELAETAASLVKLNSFQQKVTMQPETVGGPVDVALISLSEGFVMLRDSATI
ncbi:MAG: hypothetical protein EP347_09805 [Alphaproteobacteria bacterium]|nr:MAG: hypothetical protein EP347_09805 [Alphaproteobacteria bacterium]